MANKNTVICFCKHPEPGMVKSRLAADIGDKHAANIYKTLLHQTLSNITQDQDISNYEIFLYCHPDINHPVISKLETNYPITLKQQSDGDLGDKMYHALKQHLSNNNVILIGSDCLEIDSSYIRKAFHALESGNNIVLGPTSDGGYALIGANRMEKLIFDNIDWSTNQVLKQTISKIQSLGWSFSCLPNVRDIDRLEDYQYFSKLNKYSELLN